ncbi:hypothetical protein D5H75_31295 [Bailinhaonella thermotolerans]|uniref:PIN domain-containing protein n=1 Tax=Bailinhaonella thermotolerans TaxID=1070861 RepID=A0A3A4A5U1_9ACTN|nr:hypothetical protein D5H75_31295 [Bailinhaonella thermotolerans]
MAAASAPIAPMAPIAPIASVTLDADPDDRAPDQRTPGPVAADHRGAPHPARRCLVLDTSALLADPHAFTRMGDAEVVIPLTVIDELDRTHKHREDALGARARSVLRAIDHYRAEQPGRRPARQGFALPGGGVLRLEPPARHATSWARYGLSADLPGHRVLGTALALARTGRDVELITCDVGMRITADALGLATRDRRPATSAAPPGWHTVDGLSPGFVATLHRATDPVDPLRALGGGRAGHRQALTRPARSAVPGPARSVGPGIGPGPHTRPARSPRRGRELDTLSGHAEQAVPGADPGQVDSDRDLVAGFPGRVVAVDGTGGGGPVPAPAGQGPAGDDAHARLDSGALSHRMGEAHLDRGARRDGGALPRRDGELQDPPGGCHRQRERAGDRVTGGGQRGRGDRVPVPGDEPGHRRRARAGDPAGGPSGGVVGDQDPQEGAARGPHRQGRPGFDDGARGQGPTIGAQHLNAGRAGGRAGPAGGRGGIGEASGGQERGRGARQQTRFAHGGYREHGPPIGRPWPAARGRVRPRGRPCGRKPQARAWG